VLVIATVAVVLLVRAGDDDSGPEVAASTFVKALNDGDCAAYTKVTTERFQETYFRCEGDMDTAQLFGTAGIELARTCRSPSRATTLPRPRWT